MRSAALPQQAALASLVTSLHVADGSHHFFGLEAVETGIVVLDDLWLFGLLWLRPQGSGGAADHREQQHCESDLCAVGHGVCSAIWDPQHSNPAAAAARALPIATFRDITRAGARRCTRVRSG